MVMEPNQVASILGFMVALLREQSCLRLTQTCPDFSCTISGYPCPIPPA